jgi:hypothetical protein
VGTLQAGSQAAKFSGRHQGELFNQIVYFSCVIHAFPIFSDDEGGIELQILNNVIGSGATLPIDHSSRTSVEHHSQSDDLSCANSAVSVDFQEQLASTIG